MAEWLPVVIVGLLLALALGGIAWWANRERGGVARTASNMVLPPSATATSTVTPLQTPTPTPTPTAMPSATQVSTVLPSRTAIPPTPTVTAPGGDASPVAGMEEANSEKNAVVAQGGAWEQALGGPLWMQDPSNPVTPLPSLTPTQLVHVVQAGEHLGLISAQYGRTAEDLAEANEIGVDAVLQIGQELVIPAPRLGRQEGDVTPSKTPTLETTKQATATLAKTPAVVMHTVKAGDSLNAIALQYDVDAEALAEANDLGMDAVLQLDQELVVPGATPTPLPSPTSTPSPDSGSTDTPSPTPSHTPALLVHTVQEGDNLGAIALQYDVEVEAIAEANELGLNSVLQLDQELVIPGLTLTPVPSPTATLSPTPKATATPSPSPTSADTPTPTLPYRQPQLLAPPDGAMVQGKDQDVVLNWTSVGLLADDEWYMLHLWPPEEEEPMVVWTKATSWRVPTEMYPGKGVLDAIDWQVTVAVRQGAKNEVVPISLPSERYTFLWR